MSKLYDSYADGVHKLIEAIASAPTRNDEENQERCIFPQCRKIAEYRYNENNTVSFHLDHREGCPVLIAQALKEELA